MNRSQFSVSDFCAVSCREVSCYARDTSYPYDATKETVHQGKRKTKSTIQRILRHENARHAGYFCCQKNVSVFSYFLFSFTFFAFGSSKLFRTCAWNTSRKGRIVPIVTDSSTDFDSDAWFRILDRARGDVFPLPSCQYS